MTTPSRVLGRLRSGLDALVVVAATSWLAVTGGLLFWANAPMVIGWQPRLVLSGSMSPQLDPGDVVLTERVRDPAALRPGQVIAVHSPQLPTGNYLHRVVRHEPNGTLVTKGDANGSDDYPSVTPDRIVGQARAVVPMVGRPVTAWRAGNPTPLLLVVVLTGASVTLLSLRLGSRLEPETTPRRRSAGAHAINRIPHQRHASRGDAAPPPRGLCPGTVTILEWADAAQYGKRRHHRV